MLTFLADLDGVERNRNTMTFASCRSPSGDLNSPESTPEEATRERVNVTALRNVFFHNSSTCADRDKRLPVIEEPFSITFQANEVHIGTHEVEPAVEVKSDENLNC